MRTALTGSNPRTYRKASTEFASRNSLRFAYVSFLAFEAEFSSCRKRLPKMKYGQ